MIAKKYVWMLVVVSFGLVGCGGAGRSRPNVAPVSPQRLEEAKAKAETVKAEAEALKPTLKDCFDKAWLAGRLTTWYTPQDAATYYGKIEKAVNGAMTLFCEFHLTNRVRRLGPNLAAEVNGPEGWPELTVTTLQTVTDDDQTKVGVQQGVVKVTTDDQTGLHFECKSCKK